MAGLACGVLSQRPPWRSDSKRELQATPADASAAVAPGLTGSRQKTVRRPTPC